ncbi:LysR substrate-binding domain-containing protein [Rhodoferax ferrireducens]|uniref:LysR substrate-binding domain-containing protein n=1 Tax=Rhodoferax ferrireducens TaxID=192843 RepID=UPI001E3828C6|nr:LysR substrate-binding domain-containing protein [Rhodoferax ferrireducens]
MLTSMSRIPLQTLPTFRAVARLSNLRAAAEQLHLTHSAISQQMRVLEEQLGFALFDRRGRRVVLNAAGAALLSAVEPALAQIDEGVRAAALAASGTEQSLRLTALPSFAQHWLLPRMARWREQHPGIVIDLHTSLQVIDLPREGYHAALRQGKGPWQGLAGTCLIDSPLIVVASPTVARRLLGGDPAALMHEPLLGNAQRWNHWFALAGQRCRVKPVAVFNDMGMLLQAAEQGLGVALGRQLLAADALRDGRLVQLSPIALADPDQGADAFWLLHPPELQDWPPLVALRDWLQQELLSSAAQLNQR